MTSKFLSYSNFDPHVDAQVAHFNYQAPLVFSLLSSLYDKSSFGVFGFVHRCGMFNATKHAVLNPRTLDLNQTIRNFHPSHAPFTFNKERPLKPDKNREHNFGFISNI